MQTKRNLSIDVLRILCCYLVIGIHVSPIYEIYINMDVNSFEKISSLLIQGIVRTGLPIFFMISGMFILSRDVVDIKSFYKKRMVALIAPFIIYSAIHFLMTNYLSGNEINSNTMITYAKSLMLSTGVSFHFWFVYTMLGIYISAPLFAILFRSVSENCSWVLILFILLFRAYSAYFKWVIPGLEIPDFGVWLSYFLIGGLISKTPNISSSFALMALIISYTATCVITYIQYAGITSMALYSFDGGINMYVQCISLFIIFKNTVVSFSKKRSSIIESISSKTYGIYLIHIIVLNTILSVYNNSWYKENVISYTIFMTTVVFIISILFSYFIDAVITNRILLVLNKPWLRHYKNSTTC